MCVCVCVCVCVLHATSMCVCIVCVHSVCACMHVCVCASISLYRQALVLFFLNTLILSKVSTEGALTISQGRAFQSAAQVKSNRRTVCNAACVPVSLWSDGDVALSR